MTHEAKATTLADAPPVDPLSDDSSIPSAEDSVVDSSLFYFFDCSRAALICNEIIVSLKMLISTIISVTHSAMLREVTYFAYVLFFMI